MRVLNRLLAFVLALAIIATAVILAVEVVAKAFGGKAVILSWHGAYTAGERDTWDSSGVRAILGAAALLGLILLLSQLAPRRPTRLPLNKDATSVDAALTRRAVGDVLADAALDVEGVSKAKTRLKRHTAKLAVTTRFGDQTGADSLRPEIRQHVDERLASLRLRRKVSVKLTVHPGGKH